MWVTEQLIDAVVQAVRRQHPDAEHLSVLSVQPCDASESGMVHAVELTWAVAGELRAGRFIAKPATSDHEQRILTALADLSIPVPRLFAPEPIPAPEGDVLVMEALSGRPATEVLKQAGMRWEVTALAFTLARALAEVHALDWTKVTPWLEDVEALPEDLLDDQVDAMWETWETRIAAQPQRFQPVFNRALQWLDLRRPVEASICLCHGDFQLTNVLIEDDEVSGIVDWDAARVTDAAYDLALLPTGIAALGLSDEDAELFLQSAFGAYLQASPRDLGNLAFYTTARLLDRTLDALDAAAAVARGEAVSTTVERQAATAGEAMVALERALVRDPEVPWRI